MQRELHGVVLEKAQHHLDIVQKGELDQERFATVLMASVVVVFRR